MAVSVERGLLDRWRSGSNLLLRVSSPEDSARLRSALAAALADIAALGPAYLSPVIAVPGGQLLIVDFGAAPASIVRTVPDLVARHLTGAGVEEARVDTPERIGDRYSTVTGFGPAARAWLRGPLGVPLGDAPRGAPDYLLDLAAAWVRAGQPDLPPHGVIVSAEVALTWPTVAAALVPALATYAPVAVVASDFETAGYAAAVDGKFLGTLPQAALTAAGAGWTGAEVAAAMVGQRDLARAHAGEFAWAGVTAVPDARDLLSAHWTDREPVAPGAHRPGGEHVPELLVPDGMWYQVLSPGHVQRLGGPPPGARPLADGWVELTVGEAEQWVPGHPDRPDVLADARELLAGCLVDGATAMALTRERMARARARDVDGFFRRR
ncbi:hypothetical protein [Frankia sp. CiP3]|uniref:hypothetical protein n=1 Tax=Frankia sp. CiP3 TaxID=2880971 RepID=UPI001EF46FBB|nr:hypothetical protein [Frankia sp. CiP3]